MAYLAKFKDGYLRREALAGKMVYSLQSDPERAIWFDDETYLRDCIRYEAPQSLRYADYEIEERL